MLYSLQQSASSLLLFLKNVKKISVYVNEENSVNPRLIFTTEISELGNSNNSRMIPEFVAGTAKSPVGKEV